MQGRFWCPWQTSSGAPGWGDLTFTFKLLQYMPLQPLWFKSDWEPLLHVIPCSLHLFPVCLLTIKLWHMGEKYIWYSWLFFSLYNSNIIRLSFNCVLPLCYIIFICILFFDYATFNTHLEYRPTPKESISVWRQWDFFDTCYSRSKCLDV